MTAPAIAMPSPSSGRAHGTRTKYIHDGCRCMPCRIANTRYETARYARTAMPWRVRCVTSRRIWLVQDRDTKTIDLRTEDRAEAFARRDELNREAKAHDLRDPLWAGRGKVRAVRQHLATLAGHGISVRRVEELTGISRTRLLEIKNRRTYHHDRPARRRLRYETAERILAVQTVAKPADGALVPAGPTWALLDELLARGVTKRAIARALGSRAKTPQLQVDRTFVLQRTADDVRAVYARLNREV